MGAELCATIMIHMTRRPDRTGGAKPRVWFDMTFPDRNQGGSGVYARSLVAAMQALADVEVGEMRAGPPGLARTTLWLARGASRQLRAGGAELLHCPNFVVPWRGPGPFLVTPFAVATPRLSRDPPLPWGAFARGVFS